MASKAGQSSYWRWRATVLEAALVLGLIRGALSLLSFPRVLSIARLPRVARARRHAPDHTIAAVEAAARRLPGNSSCLARGLAAVFLLRAAGYAPELIIGAGRDGEWSPPYFHAWVQLDGRTILGAEESVNCAPLGAFS